ncbi:hypothetical protein [Stigmatella aurantiaca]|uniref:Secreted protein n=1 Tax=Stigmatella aurantiaca (strain DW4/3-1) TaxID=378806 RepID=Q09BP7_STIAD|nr:hypothetical protein [Stigmatella aurantiaca]ADO73995.1 uncharacterized protein STAUR_6238 [Stigmatella aurantiaca DW4/3-1]EAU69197.1 hypothetical protein STIAU_6134 [Stigmatella aurantiaca DW4/3-1]
MMTNAKKSWKSGYRAMAVACAVFGATTVMAQAPASSEAVPVEEVVLVSKTTEGSEPVNGGEDFPECNVVGCNIIGNFLGTLIGNFLGAL